MPAVGSHGVRLSGNARNTNQVTPTSEYTGAVLGGSGSGTMIGVCGSTDRKNYLTYTTPSDCNGWAVTSAICVDTWTSNTTNATATMDVISPNGSDATLTGASIIQGSSTCICVSPVDTHYTPNGTMVVKINRTA